MAKFRSSPTSAQVYCHNTSHRKSHGKRWRNKVLYNQKRKFNIFGTINGHVSVTNYLRLKKSLFVSLAFGSEFRRKLLLNFDKPDPTCNSDIFNPPQIIAIRSTKNQQRYTVCRRIFSYQRNLPTVSSFIVFRGPPLTSNNSDQYGPGLFDPSVSDDAGLAKRIVGNMTLSSGTLSESRFEKIHARWNKVSDSGK